MNVIQQIQADIITLYENCSSAKEEKSGDTTEHKGEYAAMRLLGVGSVAFSGFIALRVVFNPRGPLSQGIRIIGSVALFVLGHDCFVISQDLQKGGSLKQKVSSITKPVIETIGQYNLGKKFLNKVANWLPDISEASTQRTFLKTTYNYFLSKK